MALHETQRITKSLGFIHGWSEETHDGLSSKTSSGAASVSDDSSSWISCRLCGVGGNVDQSFAEFNVCLLVSESLSVFGFSSWKHKAEGVTVLCQTDYRCYTEQLPGVNLINSKEVKHLLSEALPQWTLMEVKVWIEMESWLCQSVLINAMWEYKCDCVCVCFFLLQLIFSPSCPGEPNKR